MSTAAQTVRFDVGGSIFKLAQSTIAKFPNALLARMTSQEWNELSDSKNSEVQVGQKRGRTEGSAIFIDRDPKLFELVLQVYRNGRVFIPPEMPRDLVAAELEFFCVDCGEEAFVTHWNLCDQIKSFDKSTDTIMEEILSASKGGMANAALQQQEAASELEAAHQEAALLLQTARIKAVAASEVMKDRVLEVAGQGIAILILSKLKEEKSFVKTIKIAKSELTTPALKQKLSSNSENQPMLDGLMKTLVDFHLFKLQTSASAKTLWNLKTARGSDNRGRKTDVLYWDVTSPSLLAVVNRLLVPMKMKANVTENPPAAVPEGGVCFGPPSQLSSAGVTVTVTLSALSD